MAVTEGFFIDDRGKVIVGMYPDFDYSHVDHGGNYTPSYARRHAPFILAGVTHPQMVAQADIDGIELPVRPGDINDMDGFVARARALDEVRVTQIIVKARNAASVRTARGGTDDG